MYNAYLFDFDYTLGDATNGIVQSINYALEQMKLSTYPKENIVKTIGMYLGTAYTHLTGDDTPENKQTFIEMFKHKADEIMLDNTNLFDDTEQVLRNIRRKGHMIAIVTTKYRYRITEVLDKFKISDLVDVIIGGEDVKNTKPDPEPLIKAIELLGVEPCNALYVGDSIIDAEAAFNAGIDFIAVTTGTTTKDEFGKFPNLDIISRLSELNVIEKPLTV